jgi:hypothetical protein
MPSNEPGRTGGGGSIMDGPGVSCVTRGAPCMDVRRVLLDLLSCVESCGNVGILPSGRRGGDEPRRPLPPRCCCLTYWSLASASSPACMRTSTALALSTSRRSCRLISSMAAALAASSCGLIVVALTGSVEGWPDIAGAGASSSGLLARAWPCCVVLQLLKSGNRAGEEMHGVAFTRDSDGRGKPRAMPRGTCTSGEVELTW